MKKIITVLSILAALSLPFVSANKSTPASIQGTAPRAAARQARTAAMESSPAAPAKSHTMQSAAAWAQTTHEKVKPASAETVQAIFPSITERVDNWRAYDPDTITVAPFPGMSIAFSRVSTKQEASLTGGHYTTWVGRADSMPGASLVTVGTSSGYDAILVVPGNGEMNFHVSGAGNGADAVSTSAVTSSEVGCGVGSVMLSPNPTPHTAAIYKSNYASVAQNVQMPTASLVAADGVPTVDLLYVYDSPSMLTLLKNKTTSDPVAFLDGQLKVVTETANVFLAQSGITTFKFNYIGLVAAPAYSRTGHLQDDLTAMSPSGVIGPWISKTRYDYGADDICLLVGSSLDYGGISNITPQQAATKDTASCVVAGGGGWGPTSNCVSAEVVAHELGHTLGCNHDRTTAGIFNDTLYCYGWTSAATSNAASGSLTNTVGTIMSYAPARIPYYSNPNVSVDIYQELFYPQATVDPVGTYANPDYGTFTIGVAVGSPNPQYNAKVMSDGGPMVAALMDPIAPVAITQQPAASTSVSTGGSLSLSVTATGGGLYYQWNKDGTAISGATAAAFSKSSLASGDAGNYTVTVSNKLGAVTSSAASVTVTAAPVTPPPSSGGGGGGAPSPWFMAVIAALALIRVSRRTR